MCISMCIHRDMTPHCAFVGGRERSLMPLSDLVLQEISDRIAEMSLELERQERIQRLAWIILATLVVVYFRIHFVVNDSLFRQ